MTDEPADDRFSSDAYLLEQRREMLHDHLVNHLRAAQATPLQISVWDEAANDGIGDHVVRTAETPARSMLLCVAQYWNDNADDEVHLELIESTRETPIWPHTCDVAAAHVERCSYCMAGGDYISWLGYAHTLSFQAFAPDGGSQGAPRKSYRPFAIARIDAAGAITVETIHPVMRPWLDLPSQRAEPMPISERVAALVAEPGGLAIAADELQRLGDPRGEMIAHALRGLDHAEALARYGRTWLGSLERYVPRSAVRYEHGVPVEIGIYSDAWLDFDPEALPWCFAPRVRFLSRSVRFPLPLARSLGPVGIAELQYLSPDVERLEIEAAAIGALPALPKLRELVILGRVDVAAVHGLRIERIEIAVEPEQYLRELIAWRDTRAIVSMYDAETERASGWSVDLGKRTLTHAGYHRDADESLRAQIQAIGGYAEIASRTWSVG